MDRTLLYFPGDKTKGEGQALLVFIIKQLILPMVHKSCRSLLLLPVIFLLSTGSLAAQVGGRGVFPFLDMTKSARIAAVGGSYLTVNDGDINNALSNPSLINEEMHNHLGLAFVDFYADIASGFASWSRTMDRIGSFAFTMQFMDYGEFDRADMTGARQGKFTAAEYAFTVGWGRALSPNFSIGANLKGVWANYDRNSSTGIAVDVAGTYISDDQRLVSSLIVSNAGAQIKPFDHAEREPIPFNIKLGVMRDPEHVPFKLFVLADNLHVWDLRYDDPEDPEKQVDPITGEARQDSDLEAFGDNLMRHMVIGGEFSLTENFHLRGGYNYRRRQEMKVPSRMAMIGFSWGLGFRISKFHFNYSRGAFHLNGSPNYISITTNLNQVFSFTTSE